MAIEEIAARRVIPCDPDIPLAMFCPTGICEQKTGVFSPWKLEAVEGSLQEECLHRL